MFYKRSEVIRTKVTKMAKIFVMAFLISAGLAIIFLRDIGGTVCKYICNDFFVLIGAALLAPACYRFVIKRFSEESSQPQKQHTARRHCQATPYRSPASAPASTHAPVEIFDFEAHNPGHA